MLSRETILGSSKHLPREAVHVPEWGGSVHVRVLTAGERDRYEIAVNETKRRDFRARLAVATVCDESGKNLFAEADIPALTALPCTGLNRVVDVALRLNKFGADDVEELGKNSDPRPDDASS